MGSTEESVAMHALVVWTVDSGIYYVPTKYAICLLEFWLGALTNFTCVQIV